MLLTLFYSPKAYPSKSCGIKKMASMLRIPITGLQQIPKSASGVLDSSKSLFSLLSRLPKDGVGERVTQSRLEQVSDQHQG